MEIKLRLEGVQRVVRRMQEVLKERPEKIIDTIQSAGNEMFYGMLYDCPVDTGLLKSTGRHFDTATGFSIEWGEGALNASGQAYWFYVEHGTQNSRAQPFLRPHYIIWKAWIMRNLAR
jgi:hypothetical protein